MKVGVTACMATLVMIAFVCATFLGGTDIPFSAAVKGLFGVGEKSVVLIMRNVRLPRAICALLVGFSLALSGCLMQTFLHNPMASPSTMGVSNAAVLGASLFIVAFGGRIKSGFLQAASTGLFAFLFAALSVVLILLFSAGKKRSAETIVLCGVALGAFFSAGSTVLQYFAEDTEVSAIVFWTMGDLSAADGSDLIAVGSLCALSLVVFSVLSGRLNAMAMGEETAESLGINVPLFRFLGLLCASLLCAACVSVVGLIGFVGLVSPHIAKKAVGADHRFTLPVSGLTGSLFMLCGDILSRVIAPGIVLPVGAITSAVGAPLFLWLLLSKRRGKWRLK